MTIEPRFSGYRWASDWGSLPGSRPAGWAHPGIATLQTGEIIATHPDGRTLVFFSTDGDVIRTLDSKLTEVHSITPVVERDATTIWLSDPGFKLVPAGNASAMQPNRRGQVIALDLDGNARRRLPLPDGYRRGAVYRPTSVVVDERSLGGDGSIWVADGYGLGLVHRFSSSGQHLLALSGEESGRAFSTPHGLFIDRSRDAAQLYVADRGNQCVQVFDLEGRFKESFGGAYLTSPSAFAVVDGYLLIVELRARVVAVDHRRRPTAILGDNEAVSDTERWPNEVATDGSTSRPKHFAPRKFHSPHAITVDAAGNIYVAEFVLGGRQLKLSSPTRT
jgi:hypothetical protein